MKEIQRRMDQWGESVADFVVDTSGLPSEKVADKIITLINGLSN